MLLLALVLAIVALGCAIWSLSESHLTIRALHVLAERLEDLEKDLGR